MENKILKPLHLILDLVKKQLELSLRGVDVAVPYIIGPPGGGKTASIYNIFSDWAIYSFHFAFTPIEEIGGLPRFKEVIINGEKVEGTTWTLPDIITSIYELSKNGKVLIFIDDFHLCSPTHMSYGYQLFTERKLRNYKLPNNCAILLAGNSSTHAGAKTIFSGIANRVCFYPVFTDFEYWKYNYALGKVNHKILSFLSQNVNQRFFHMEEQMGKPWASPRSWTRLSNLLNPMEEAVLNINFDDILYLATSHIGEEAAASFARDYIIFSKYNMKKVFDTGNFEEPESPYIYLSAGINEFINRWMEGGNKKDKAIEVMVGMFEFLHNKNPELVVAGLKEIVLIEKHMNIKSMYIKIKQQIKNQNLLKSINDMISML